MELSEALLFRFGITEVAVFARSWFSLGELVLLVFLFGLRRVGRLLGRDVFDDALESESLSEDGALELESLSEDGALELESSEDSVQSKSRSGSVNKSVRGWKRFRRTNSPKVMSGWKRRLELG